MGKKAGFRFPTVGWRFPIERPHPPKDRKVEFQFPIKGKDSNNPIEKQPLQTSPDLENVRPYDQLEIRMRGGQRPGCRKWGAGSRIGGGDYRIDKLVAATATEMWITPMTWLLVPYVYSCGSISMAATVLDAYYGVEYEFDCTSDDTYDSGWQDSNVHTITGLTSETPLTFRCRAREKSPGIKVTDWSSSENVTPNAKPQPDPLTWATEPYFLSEGEIAMVATTATDPSGVEYYFTCESGAGGNDRDWGDSASYTDTGLTPETEYCYSVKARDKSGLQCEGAKSPTKCASAGYDWGGGDYHPYPKLPGLTTANVWKTIEDSDALGVVWSYDTGGAWVRDIAVDGSGNVYVGGARAGNKSIWKLNSSGVLQWSYDTGNDINAIQVDGSGNVFACGKRGTDEDGQTAAVWKLNTNGVKQWEYDIEGWGGSDGYQYGIDIDSSGNIFVAGNLGEDEDTNIDSIRKLNSSGVNILQNLSGSYTRLKIDSADNLLITRGADNSSEKLDNSIEDIWLYAVGAHSYGVAIDSNDNVFLFSDRGTDADSNLGTIRKLDSDGVHQWTADTGSGTGTRSADVDGSDNIYVAGANSLWKYDNSGNLQWSDTTGAVLQNVHHDNTNIYIVGNRVTV